MIAVDIIDNEIVVQASSRLADVIAQIPGLLATEADTWTGPITASTLCSIAAELAHLPGFQPGPSASAAMLQVQNLRVQVQAVKDEGLDEAIDPRLYDYQRAGVWMLANRRRVLLGDEMGTGKTVQALVAARQVFARTTLVVCPNSMKHRWAREVETWFPEARAFVLEGTPKQRDAVMDEVTDILLSTDDFPIVVTVNWEALPFNSRVGPYGSEKLSDKDRTKGPLNRVLWECVIADEAHRAKNPKGKHSRALAWLAKGATYRWALTGTPVLNTPGDLWAIGRFYDPDTYGNSRHRWHNRYVDTIESFHGPKDIGLRRDRATEFTAWFDLNFIRRTKNEVLDLPEITKQVREIPLTSQQRSAYNKLVKDMVVTINDEFLAVNDPLVLLTRLSQIASATPVIEDLEVVALDTPSNKVDAVLEIIESMGIPDSGRQLVVFSGYELLASLIASEIERKGISLVRITGQESAGVKDMNVQTFQAGDASVAVCTLGAGSEGIDLYAADTAVFAQRSYAYGDNQQAESRIHRNGQTADKVTIIDLVSIGTLDSEVLSALESKGERAEEVLRDQARALLTEKVQ